MVISVPMFSWELTIISPFNLETNSLIIIKPNPVPCSFSVPERPI